VFARRVLALALLLTTIGCDRVTKHLAATNLEDMPARSYIAGTLRLEYAENTGAFLGVGSGLPEWAQISLLRIGVGLALAALAFTALRRRWTGLLLLGASLTFAGGASNLLDRITRGSVVDFLSVGAGPLRTGIFNVADVAILLGGVFMVLDSGRRERADTPGH
jgi:signal peptidase II